MRYYPESDSHIRDKVKTLLDFSNYAAKKEFQQTAVVDTSELVNVPVGLTDSKTKVDDL